MLEGRGVYIIEVFDHPLSAAPSKLAEPIGRLARDPDSEREFIEAYLNTGKKPRSLSGGLTGCVPFVRDCTGRSGRHGVAHVVLQ